MGFLLTNVAFELSIVGFPLRGCSQIMSTAKGGMGGLENADNGCRRGRWGKENADNGGQRGEGGLGKC